MRTPIQTLLVAAALGTIAVPARAQEAKPDARWLPYVGCWEPVEGAKSPVCVVPVSGTAAAVDLITIAKGAVVTRERITANAEQTPAARADCSGWQSAAWSPHGQRVYLRSSGDCGKGDTRNGTGLIAMTANGEWLYVQGMTLNGQTGVRVERYREAGSDLELPSDIAAAVRLDVTTALRSRTAAGAPLAIEDVIEASRQLDTPVLEAWLMERGEPFALNAKRLIQLADAKVPPRIIDVMVALSNPQYFALHGPRAAQRASAAALEYPGGRTIALTMPIDRCSQYDMMYPYDMFYSYSPYSSAYCSGLGGYGYGYGWYNYPVSVVYTGPSGRSHGRVVNGQGYVAGSGGTAGGSGQAQPRSGEVTPSGGYSRGGGSTTTTSTSSSGSSSSSGGGERTAHPRPH
jgi:hypothetical protein